MKAADRSAIEWSPTKRATVFGLLCLCGLAGCRTVASDSPLSPVSRPIPAPILVDLDAATDRLSDHLASSEVEIADGRQETTLRQVAAIAGNSKETPVSFIADLAADDEPDVNPTVNTDGDADSGVVPAATDKSHPHTPVSLEQVTFSVLRHYPLVQAAWQQRSVADGNQLAAWGEFDTRLKAASENQPLGFYETYRNSAGVSQPLYGGGEVFGAYRNGGGDFEPWYLERETNDGGEFKGGVRVPLLRDKRIDARRAEVWRRTYDQQLADPFIRSMIIQFAAQAGQAYWKWVAAGQKYQLGVQWLELARSRNAGVKLRVELEDLDPPELTENRRAIAKREAKLADSRRILEQAAQKLSLFLRDNAGRPYVPQLSELPEFPALRQLTSDDVAASLVQARNNRPELQALSLKMRQLQVDYAEACNLTRPRLDAQLTGSQDVGEPTSSKRDKSEFEVEAGLYFDFPVQQRKGRGKAYAAQAKMARVSAKRRLVAEKVETEVRSAFIGLRRSRQEALLAQKAARLANEVAGIEYRKFELGESDLLKVAIREQYALDAAEEQVKASLNHFSAFTEYAAALSIEQPSTALLPSD